MAEPRGMISTTKQPIGWPTHRYQHCLKSVLPSRSSGTNMKLHQNVPRELLPTATYNRMPGRWRVETLPPVRRQQPSEETHQTHSQNQTAKTGVERQDIDEYHRRDSKTRSAHYDVRPPSAYSDSIILKPPTWSTPWVRRNQLDTPKLKALLRENTYQPGNFSTLNKCSREKVEDMVNRLSYDPYERREQLILDSNPEGDAPFYSKADIDEIVKRLATTKPMPEPIAEQEKKMLSKELSAKAKEIVDRLSKYEHPADKVVEDKTDKKTITEAEVEKMLQRLTQKHERTLPAAQPEVETKKVSSEAMETILSRLTTYDSQKWPPESKPEIYRLHTKVE
ncbi:uncharacterized protein [Watersipora subatra]|uniref:uncharacterized protein n=1 Tax=Watersipora subatra TaxID=2589382 RepID=UPI00355C0942